ncbi:unnamed protein product [Urochloa humidicola]
MLDLSTMTIEDTTGCLKAVDDQDEEATINIGGRLYYTESWLALQKEQKKGEATGSVSGRPHVSRKKNNKAPHPRNGSSGSEGECEEIRDDTCRKCGKTGHWVRNCKKGKGGDQAHLTMMADADDEPALF